MGLETHAYTANPGKKINEAKAVVAFRSTGSGLLQEVAQGGFKHRWAWCLTFFPAPYGFCVLPNVFGDLSLRVSATGLLKQFHWLGKCHFVALSGKIYGHYDTSLTQRQENQHPLQPVVFFLGNNLAKSSNSRTQGQ
jgi:hypothetical protein